MNHCCPELMPNQQTPNTPHAQSPLSLLIPFIRLLCVQSMLHTCTTRTCDDSSIIKCAISQLLTHLHLIIHLEPAHRPCLHQNALTLSASQLKQPLCMKSEASNGEHLSIQHIKVKDQSSECDNTPVTVHQGVKIMMNSKFSDHNNKESHGNNRSQSQHWNHGNFTT